MGKVEEALGARASRRWVFGEQSIWEAAPDVIRLSLVGTIDGPELAQVYAKMRECSEGKPFWITLVDASRFANSTRSARAVVMAQTPSGRSTTILYGLSFTARMLIDLTQRAKRRLNPNAADVLSVVATEADAWAEVKRIRARRAASGAGA